MRNVVYAINISLDGCCDHTKMTGSDEVHEYFAQQLREVDVLAYGRATYQLMFPFWPDVARNRSGTTHAMNEFAEAFTAVKSVVVFSKTLGQMEQGNVRVAAATPEDEIRRLKGEPGKDIMLGGVSIPGQLIERGLVDEFRFLVQPLLVGGGRRLLEGIRLPEKLQLKLVESKALKSGYLALRYLNPLSVKPA
jgi:dihydrofolate reductase